jgi:hypothetical protein
MINHVVDLPTSKLLSPYLEGQESRFYWVPNASMNPDNWIVDHRKFTYAIPALLLSEVLELLPKEIGSFALTIDAWREDISYVPQFSTEDSYLHSIDYGEDTKENISLITAAAKLLLYLHQNGYMEEK